MLHAHAHANAHGHAPAHAHAHATHLPASSHIQACVMAYIHTHTCTHLRGASLGGSSTMTSHCFPSSTAPSRKTSTSALQEILKSHFTIKLSRVSPRAPRRRGKLPHRPCKKFSKLISMVKSQVRHHTSKLSRAKWHPTVAPRAPHCRGKLPHQPR